MSGSAILGIALAVGHHLFYQSLNGKPASNTTSQTWNFRVGIGFTFLVKTSLTTAASVAAVQNIWCILHQKAIKVLSIDSLFGILGNARRFLDVSTWFQALTVVFIAMIAW